MEAMDKNTVCVFWGENRIKKANMEFAYLRDSE